VNDVSLSADPDGPVVLFDGVCNLCNSSVQFILDHERDQPPHLRFAPLQSEAGLRLLEGAFGKEGAREIRESGAGGSPDTLVFIEDHRGVTRSSAVLRIARYLRAPWRWSAVLVVVPSILRDLVYRFVAKNRYRWFGKSETCRVPTPELRRRFLA
jgi:predicted DCC family thiol-disulfide oxidoreductase YuxK